ncbi:MAG: succinate dehydrogenase/fumarate reductase cytochrome b subunit [Bacteroidales bacterium]|nr:succinate dehydrogenase/fumarate reductase cytochrome b subunit [Bacteroidales bacterium]MDD4361113.1 succinate dehydrogenase/fumarate reductase cytochrome b subunit [Bacteroidales bacterium]MDD4431325.1 succinate dehydrogenase/fumarate reductase cytochrome b subunit [Bacteroidales bacterium]
MAVFIINSSIGRKLIMSITGAALVLFLTFHSIMNIFVIISPEVYDAICHFLGANWYALVATMGLAFLMVVHILYAFWLSLQNKIARGKDVYAVNKRPKGVEWASQNMLVLGIIVLGFLGLHLYNFWYKMQLTELIGKINGEEVSIAGAALVEGLFQSPVYCLLYIVWLVALWFHLTHGVWSALQSIGLSNNTWLPRIKVISNIVSTIVVGLFILIPIYYLIVNLIL